MKSELVNENALDEVVGGSIIFNADNTTCGRHSNAEYKVLNYDKVSDYIKKNCTNMSEKTMISNMVSMGYLCAL